MYLIGIGHKKRRGKDVLADALVSRHGYERFSLADGVREAVAALDPHVVVREEKRFLRRSRLRTVLLSTLLDEAFARTGDHRLAWDEIKAHPSVRRLLQRMGTEVGRELFGEEFWVRHLERRIRESGASRVVVPDVRFPSEAKWVIGVGGTLVRVDRDVPADPDADSHPSETALDDWFAWDVIVVNDGTLADLAGTSDDVAARAGWAWGL